MKAKITLPNSKSVASLLKVLFAYFLGLLIALIAIQKEVAILLYFT
jgi:hypothetical protein